VDDILALAFPYHETMMFARVLQLLRLSEDTGRWHWLYPVQKEGVPLSKTALLNRAGSDMSFLKFVCDMPTDAIKVNFLNFCLDILYLNFVMKLKKK
jgi:U3 small nucleolar RNA-associated protein 10